MSGLILDTHIWFWLNVEQERDKFSPKIISAIEDAQDHDRLYIASITLWEIALMSRKSRLIFDRPVKDWLDKALTVEGLFVLPLSSSIALESVNLPGNFHSDPADQLIVATARVEKLTLITCDRKILKYAEQNYIKSMTL